MKPNAKKVHFKLAELAVQNCKSKQDVYSMCVKLSFQTRGTLNCGFDNKDLQEWINIYYPDLFDKRGNKIKGIADDN